MLGKRKVSRLASLLCAVVMLASFGAMTACDNTSAKTETEPAANAQWYYGAEVPADSLGNVGDHYLDTQSLRAYVRAANGTWQQTALFSGANAPDDANGEEGDLYLDLENGILYQKGESLWEIVLTVKGENGRDGVVWFSGAIDPDTYPEGDTTLADARKGDFYLNTTEFTVWQLGADKAWNNLGSIKPADGEKGGDGNLWYYGTTEPEDANLSAKEGDFYMRSYEPVANGDGMYTGYKIYTCRADGSWKLVVDNSPCAFLGTEHTFKTQNNQYVCTACGYVAYTYDAEHQTISFGEYPQSQVADKATTDALTKKAGALPTAEASGTWTSYKYYVSGKQEDFMWYQDVELGGYLYRGVYFTQYRPGFTTQNSPSYGAIPQKDNNYLTGTVYWFKFEPVTWRILKEESGKMLVMADTVLDSQAYGISSGKYDASDIHTWLNDAFFKMTFDLCAQKNIIQQTEVDNSATTLPSFAAAACACGNTQDKVFLLSYQEAMNSEYFSDKAAKQMTATAYAMSQGLAVNYQDMFGPIGGVSWWLRSLAVGEKALNNREYAAAFIGYEGDPCQTSSMFEGNTAATITETDLGVVPAMWVATDAE